MLSAAGEGLSCASACLLTASSSAVVVALLDCGGWATHSYLSFRCRWYSCTVSAGEGGSSGGEAEVSVGKMVVMPQRVIFIPANIARLSLTRK